MKDIFNEYLAFALVHMKCGLYVIKEIFSASESYVLKPGVVPEWAEGAEGATASPSGNLSLPSGKIEQFVGERHAWGKL